MAATLHDVARLAGVSIKTVSNVVHEYAHVRATTRQRVLAAIDELGYSPNLSARSLKSGRTGVIGLAVPELSLSYFAELADAVIRSADRHGVTVLIEQTGGDRQREIDLLSSTRRQMTDGLLFSVLGMANDDAEYGLRRHRRYRTARDRRAHHPSGVHREVRWNQAYYRLAQGL